MSANSRRIVLRIGKNVAMNPRLAVTLVGLALIVVVAYGKNCPSSLKREYGCYFPNWANYHGYDLEKYYEPGLCSIILYAFAVFDSNFKAKPFDAWADLPDGGGKNLYGKINGLKRADSNLRTLISMGGWTFSQGGTFEKMAASGADTFIKSSIALARMYDFDGIDIDWEYPTDKKLFTDFLTKFRKAIDSEAKKCKQKKCKKLLLTAAVAGGPGRIADSYEVPAVQKLLDYIFLMSYDYHGSWEQSIAGPNAPLNPYKGDNKQNSIKAGVAAWKAGGTPSNKIIVGLAAYGHGWTLGGGQKARYGAAANGPSPGLPKTNERGTAAYHEVCDSGKQSYDKKTATVIVKDGNEMYSIDNEKSLKAKASWICDECLGGAFMWDMSKDDYEGKCKASKKKRHPLLKRQKKGMLACK